MSNFIKQLVNQKLKSLTTDELLSYARAYHFSITRKQANDIISYLRESSSDPFDPDFQVKTFNELARITDRETAKKAQTLFEQLISSYGLRDLFS